MKFEKGYKVLRYLKAKKELWSASTQFFQQRYYYGRWNGSKCSNGPLGVFKELKDANRFKRTMEHIHSAGYGEYHIYECEYVKSKETSFFSLIDGYKYSGAVGFRGTVLVDKVKLGKRIQTHEL